MSTTTLEVMGTKASPPPIALVLAGAGIAVAGWAAAMSRSAHASGAMTVAAALVAVWAVAGALLARKPASTRLGYLVLGITAIASFGALGAARLPLRGVTTAQHSLAVAARAGLLGLIPVAGLHLLLGMPNGSLGSNARRVLAALGYAIGAAASLYLWSQRPDLPLWPLAVETAVVILVGGSAIVSRGKRASPGEQRSIKWFVWSTVVVVGLAVAAFALRALAGWPSHVSETVTAATALLPLSLAFSTSERLAPGIDHLLAQTVSLAGLSALVSAVYLGIVLGLGRVPQHEERTLLVLSMIAAGLVALLYVPTRARLARFANKVVYGERNAPDDVIRTFGSRLSRAIPLDELLLQMAESLRKTLTLDAAEVWTGSGGQLERTVSDPDVGRARVTLSSSEEPIVARAGVSGPAWMKVWLPQMLTGREHNHVRVAPITHSGDLLGLIVIERDSGTRPFSEEEERTLTELARQVGLALHNVRLDSALQASLDEVRRQASALQASRGRIVAAADAERRRIERNLHDGAQQHLVALAVKVRLARQLMEMDQAQANTILEELSGDVQETLQELRDLAHGIYPPLLADRGLAEALTASSGRSPIPTTVHAQDINRYSPEIEAAIYFCCLEALQNVGKYGGDGSTATIRIWEEAGGLIFEVADTGAGFDTSRAGMGAGFTNMNDRLGAIGGTLRIESAPGRGTKVGGAIPLPA